VVFLKNFKSFLWGDTTMRVWRTLF